MVRYIIKRLFIGVVTIWALITITFFLIRIMPGSPFEADNLSQSAIEQLESTYGLDEPMWKQYILYMENLMHGDLGISYKKNVSVNTLIARGFPYTLSIGLLSIPGWIGMARQVRGQLIALKEQEFSMAALVIGASDARILFRHLLINAIGPIIVQITFLVPNAIFTEAFLSFIGIGISAPMASWGSMAQDARQVLTMHPGQLLLPTICICITIFSLNFLGEGIGDAFNPKKTRG